MDFTQKFEESCQTCQPEQDNFVILKAEPWETTQCKKSAFSLMEMMTVMLVVSVIMALSAPMITKKNAGDVSIRSLWTALTGGNIGYNLSNEDTSAIIGGGQGHIPTTVDRARLIIVNDGSNPHIGFMNYFAKAGNLTLHHNGIELGNGASIGTDPDSSVAIGNNAKTTKHHAVAIGRGTEAALGGVAVGDEAKAEDYAVAIGDSENSSTSTRTTAGTYSVALGYASQATTSAIAIGNKAKAVNSGYGDSGIAIGNQAQATGANSIALGSYYQTGGGGDYKTAAKGSHAISIGSGAIAAKDSSIAIGAPQYLGSGYSPSSNALGNYSIAIGSAVNATSDHSIAIGSADSSAGTSQTNAGIGSVAIGRSADVKNNGIGIGNNVSAANNTIAIGVTSQATAGQTKTKASGSQTVAIGHGVEASGTNSIAIGSSAGTAGQTKAYHKHSIAIGHSAKAGSSYATAKDYSNTIAIGHAATISDNVGDSIAIGRKAIAGLPEGEQWGSDLVAIGHSVTAKSFDAIAIGSSISADQRAVAIGSDIESASGNSVVIGHKAFTSTNSVAIGNNAQARQSNSIAIGIDSLVKCNGNGIAIGPGVTVEGKDNIAIGFGVHIDKVLPSGGGLVTSPNNMIVLGNSSSTVYIPGNLVVGKATWLGVDTDESKSGAGYSQVYIRWNYANGLNGASKARDQIRRLYEHEGSTANYLFHDGASSSGYLPPAGIYNSYSSDRRLKDIIGENLDAMDKINKLKVYNYTYKKDDLKTPHVGVVAQELEKIFPNAVSKDENGFLQIRHEDMFYTMINALKELYAKLVEKDHEIKVLKKELKELRKEVNELKKLIKNR